MQRFYRHIGNIKNKIMNTDIGAHYNSDGHQGLKDVDVHIVEFINKNPHSDYAQKLRNKLERNWMLKLRTQVPHGLNLIDAPNF